MRSGLRLTGALTAAMLFLSGCEDVNDRVARHVERGVEFVESGDFAKAQLEFRNAIKLDETSIPGWLELAKLLEKEKKLGEAFSHFLKVLELDPNHVEALIHTTQIALLAGELDRALEYANTALAAAPQNAEVLAVKSAVSLRVGNLDAAQSEANAALAIDPANVGAAIVLITKEREAGNTAAALEIADRFLAQAPEDLSLNLSKLQLLSTMGDNEGLGGHLEKLTRIFPEITSFRTAWAEFLVSKGDIDGAVAQFRSVSQAKPEDAAAALDVARFLIRVRGLEAGRAELESLVARAPGVIDYTLALATLDYSNGRQEEARARLRAVIDSGAAAATVAQARIQLARFLISDKDLVDARTQVEAVLAGDTRNADALGLRGAILIEQGDTDGAILDIRAALGERPDDVRLLQLAATAFQQNGSQELAGESLGKAARVSNFDPEISLRYADFLVRTNQTGGAGAVLAEAARRNPSNREVLGALAEVRLRLKDWVGAEQVAQALRAIEDGAETADRVMAAALTGQERFSESIALLRDMSSADAGSRDANMAALISVYVRAGQHDQAKAFLESVLQDNPDNGQARLLRAALHRVQGELAEAEAIYKDMAQRAPDSATAYGSLAEFYLTDKRDAEAEAVLLQGLEAATDKAPLRLMLAQVLERRADFDGAIAQYEALYATNPDSVVVANNLASLLIDHRADDAASLELAKTVAVKLRASTVPQFLDTYGWTMYLAGDYEEALGSLIPAVEALPDNPWVQFHVGMAYARLNQADLARKHLELALKLAEGAAFTKTDEVRATLASLPATSVAQ